MPGALSGDDEDMQQYLMASAAGRAPAQMGGALSASDDYSEDPDAYMDAQSTSPQEMRDLQTLAYVKGLNQPTRTGSSNESFDNAIGGQYQALAEHVKQNAAMRLKLAAIAASKNMQMQQAEKEIQGKKDVATIMAGKNAEHLLSDAEIQDAGLPPGTSAAVNNFGKVRVIHSPPAAQQMLTGFDGSGKPQYADPGAALTPQMRTSIQDYLKQANQVKPQLQQLMQDMQTPGAQTSMGGTGKLERGANAIVGQIGNLIGARDSKNPMFPKDTALNDRMKKLNELAMPVLEADPRHQALGGKAKEELEDMLPEPESWGLDPGTAHTKYKDLMDMLNTRSDEYNAMLKGHGLTNAPSNEGGDLPAPPTPKQLDQQTIMQHAREAIANGKDPAAVAKAAKDRYGVDINGAP